MFYDKDEKELRPSTKSNPRTWELYSWWEGDRELDESDMESSNMEWMSIRSIAWAARLKDGSHIPDNHLPPIYGKSQVIDFESTNQPEVFKVECAVEIEDIWDIDYSTNLNLFYKFNDAETGKWTEDWYLYEDSVCNEHWDEKEHKPWEFEFDVNKANGSGEYRFHSKLFVSYKDASYYWEPTPPDYDAECSAGVTGSAYMDWTPVGPLVNQEIKFNDKSVSNNAIESWQWDFGDENTSTSQNPFHSYTQDGNYAVSLNVTDNESNFYVTTRNITVYNNHPSAQFTCTTEYIGIGSDPRRIAGGVSKTVSFQSYSTDPDGEISNSTWDLGDGKKGYGQMINHTYNVSDFYTVSLKVKDDDNSTDESVLQNDLLVVNAVVNGGLQSDDLVNFTWNSVQKAMDNLTTCDILYILNGTYNENLILNKSVFLYGQDCTGTIINGTVTMMNPFDHELVENGDYDGIVNMSGNNLLFHFNNDTGYGEDYPGEGVVVDFSGEKNNGSIYGASWKDSSLKGPGALLFDGQDDSVNISNVAALSGENVTVSSWIYWTGGSGVCDPVLSQSNGSDGYMLYVNSTDGKPAFRLDGTEVVSSTNVSVGWHHLVGNHNETLLRIYVDGVLKGSQPKTGSGSSFDAYVGFDNVSNFYNGTIDEIAVWNRTFSDEEILVMYQANYGACLDNFEIRDRELAVIPCNHSVIKNCRLINNSVGIDLNDTWDVTVENCYIFGSSIGINVSNVYPGMYDRNYIINVTSVDSSIGVQVNSSSNLSIASSYFNCSGYSILFNVTSWDGTIFVVESEAWGNVAPDIPCRVYNGPTLGDPGVTYTYKSKTNDSNGDQLFYLFEWGDGSTSGWLGPYWSNVTVEASHSWAEEGGYFITVSAKDAIFNESNCSEPLLFRTENLSPLINSVNQTPGTVGFGFNVTITVNVTDNKTSNWSGIRNVSVNVTFPDNTSANYSMNYSGNNTYECVFDSSWLRGQYNYTIWAVDNAYNTNSSTGYSFNVSSQANISVCSLEDVYEDNELILLTDPPSGNPPLVGYELLNDGDVLHIWNKFDSYYFDTNSGMQFSNHFNEYWSHNVLMLGYYNNNEWNLIYRTDELSGFTKNVNTDNETYVNVTLWKNLEYKGYDFCLAIRYYLGIDDNELTVIPYIKNIDQSDIPYVLAFGWEMKDIQVDMTESNDYIYVNRTMYYLNQTLNNTYTGLLDPEFYLTENITNITSKSLYLKWNESLNYKLHVKSRDGQYNAPTTLFVRIGTLDSGQSKQTKIYWYDANQEIYHFNSHDNKEYWANNPSYMVDGSTSNFASTSVDGQVELCNGNTCPGEDLGTISKVELRVHGYYSGDQRDIIFRPVFDGVIDGSDYYYQATTTPSWSQWFEITNYQGASWDWQDIVALDCDVETGTGMLYSMVFTSKVELRITYNIAPVVSGPVPTDGSTGVSTKPVLNITVADSDGNLMNLTWYTNSTPSSSTLRPNANGSATQLDRYPSNLSANYKCLDEVSFNDTDYVKWNGTYWKNDTYAIQNHTSETGMINNVNVVARCARIDSWKGANMSSFAKIIIKSGGSCYDSKLFTPSVNYSNYSYTWTFNPATGNAWTWSDIDNLETGIGFLGNQGISRCSQLYVEVNYTDPSSSWVAFGTNSSINNGTYHQTFTNGSVNGRWWFWKVYVHDGRTGVYSDIFKFYTGCESKIENTGSTNINGYLLTQVQWYNSSNSTWEGVDDTVNETTPRIINSSEQLGLDTVFNGLVDTSDLSDYGNGTYRIYAAFRDPDGNVLICDDETELEATYEFTITY